MNPLVTPLTPDSKPTTHLRFAPLSLSLLASFMVSACGNIMKPPKGLNTSLASTTGSFSLSSAHLAPRDYTCPSEANVTPHSSYYLDGSMQFIACPHQTDTAAVYVTGEPHSSNAICVFPAEYIDQNHVYSKPLTPGGSSQVACGELQSLNQNSTQNEGRAFSFSATNYNAIFVVEQSNLNAMRTCLDGGNYYACPPFSFGVFR